MVIATALIEYNALVLDENSAVSFEIHGDQLATIGFVGEDFPHFSSGICKAAPVRSSRLLEEVWRMTSIPRDSDIVVGMAMLTLLLVIGLARVFGW